MARAQITLDFDACRADPVEFTRTLLRQPDGSRWEPFPAQIEIMHGIKRNTTVLTGRQFSKTTILGWVIAWFSCTKPNSNCFILAPTLDQTRLIFSEVAHYFRTTLKSFVDGKIKNSPFPEITLKNGSIIKCRGLNRPEYVRGNRAHLVVVDEAAFVKEGSIKDVVEQLLLVTGKREGSALVLTSTPFGNGEYYDFTSNARKQQDRGNERFAYFHYTSYDNPYADREQLEEVKERYGEDSPIWLAEYMGVFQDDETAVFRSADIKAAYEMWPGGTPFPVKPIPDHRYIQGLDLANRNDYTVATILDATDRNAVQLVRMDRARRLGYARYKAMARTNHAAYNRARTIADATSLGESVAEDLRDISIVPYAISSNSAKWEIVQELSRMFQERRLIIPQDKDIIAELNYFRYHITPSKVMRMEAPRGKHDDIVMSLALAAHLAVIPTTVAVPMSADLAQPHAPKMTRDEMMAFNPLYDPEFEELMAAKGAANGNSR
jgi:hypothetical protein